MDDSKVGCPAGRMAASKAIGWVENLDDHLAEHLELRMAGRSVALKVVLLVENLDYGLDVVSAES